MTNFIRLNSARMLLITGAAALGLTFTAPAAIAGSFGDLSFDGIDLDIDSEDFLQKLIDMDAADIVDLRADMAEARSDIKGAIADIEQAREEASETPESRAIFAAALAAASESVTSSTKEVFEKVGAALDRAETDLVAGKIEVSAEEVTETKFVIAILREELGGIEAALGELVAAMKAA